MYHSDLHYIDGNYVGEMPTILGHEAAGIVEKVGSNVAEFSPDERVINCLSFFCRHCRFCLSGHPYICQSTEMVRNQGNGPRLFQRQEEIHQFYNLSSFAEQILVHEHALVKIETEISLDCAALIRCGILTGYGAVIHTAKVEVGSTVAVIGCGGVGLSTINGPSIAGAGRIIAIDVKTEKLSLAMQMGVTDTINAIKIDPVEQVLEMTSGRVDFSFEALGRTKTVEQAFSMLAPSGMATIIGMISQPQKISIVANELLSDKKLVGSMMVSNRFRIDMPRLVQFYRDGRLKLDQLISKRISLDHINAGMDELREGNIARLVITFSYNK